MILRLQSWFCRTFHRQVTLPIHGRYTCLTCQRTYPVPWEVPHG